MPAPRQLLDQFRTHVRGQVDLSALDVRDGRQRPMIVERVADAVWSYLAPTLRPDSGRLVTYQSNGRC